MINPIYPCLWFNGTAKEAATFYCDVFQNGIISTDTPTVLIFNLHGQQFMGLNGGPKYKPNPSISFFVVCETETEADAVWYKLESGGTVMMPYQQYPWSEKYGWVQDRFGISWQIALGKLSDVGQKFTPVLMFTHTQAGNAQKAIDLYMNLFQPSSLVGILHYQEGDGEPLTHIKHAQFHINNQVFMIMDSSGPHDFIFSEGISLVVECEKQEEIDFLWNKLTEGGAESMCGWLKDPFGVSWQIIPAILGKLMSDTERGGRVMQALLKMKKLDIDTLSNA